MRKIALKAACLMLTVLLLAACGSTSSGVAGGASSIQDVPLAELLHKRQQAKEDDALGVEFLVMGQAEGREELIPVTQNHLAQLQKAGVLPQEVYEQALPYLQGDLVTYIHTKDALGCETLSCNFGLGIVPPYYVNSYLDTASGKLYGFGASFPFIYPMDDAGREEVLKAYLAYTGLDAFGDWEKQPYAPDESADEGMMAPYGVSYRSNTAKLEAKLYWHSTEVDFLFVNITLAVVA